MILAEAREPMTKLFPERVPESTEAMTPEESAALAGWQASPQGRALYAALASHIARRLGIASGRVISVGEGEGLLASALARLLPRATVIGTDICPVAIERARERHNAPNLRFELVAAAETARLGPADAVVCCFALHHFEHPRAALSAMIAALAPGGRLYVHDLRRDADAGSYFRILDLYVDVAPEVAKLHRASVRAAYTISEVRRLLAISGRTKDVQVGALRLDSRDLDAFRAVSPAGDETLSHVASDGEGLWLEGMAVVVAEEG